MALEAVVFSEGLFGSWAMAAAPGGGWSWGHGENEHGGAMDLEGVSGSAAAAYWEVGASSSMMMQGADHQEPDGSCAAALPENAAGGGNAAAAGGAGFSHEVAVVAAAAVAMSPAPPAGRRKRLRTRSVKNREEVESQRMTHIAVERNRRKQMNEYLAALRSLMPPSYVQRGDQASIIGGAINYVKELEQLLQSLEARKHARRHDLSPGAAGDGDAAAGPFAGFFTFPQYSMSAGAGARSPATANTPPADGEGPNNADADGSNGDGDGDAASGSRPSSVADVEVTMVESHASLKLLSRRRPRQLLRLVAGLQSHRLTVLHLNATSDARRMALYSLSLKVEDDCALSSVDDIAAAVHGIVEAVDGEEGGAELLGSQAEEEEEE
ncbi:transcription factor bHLH94-like [Panicum miliaceum]|uniref:Transcription factor bHLH94-like n=1 Tax=Panicum miliaceum TaxID=4540 RepID=A0A3L6RF59_PANMI|nr:transcription factor bHLH94-like [Panicum miliaceum]